MVEYDAHEFMSELYVKCGKAAGVNEDCEHVNHKEYLRLQREQKNRKEKEK